jgi:hypothetical protein
MDAKNRKTVDEPVKDRIFHSEKLTPGG